MTESLRENIWLVALLKSHTAQPLIPKSQYKHYTFPLAILDHSRSWCLLSTSASHSAWDCFDVFILVGNLWLWPGEAHLIEAAVIDWLVTSSVKFVIESTFSTPKPKVSFDRTRHSSPPSWVSFILTLQCRSTCTHLHKHNQSIQHPLLSAKLLLCKGKLINIFNCFGEIESMCSMARFL
jgi:hypothetical protein